MPAEIDYANARSVGNHISAALAVRPAVLVVDLAGTTFCDSAGIALARAHRIAAAAATQIRLVVPAGGLVIRVFNLTGVDQCPADRSAVSYLPRRVSSARARRCRAVTDAFVSDNAVTEQLVSVRG